MNQIDNITDQADQQVNVILPDGSGLACELVYQPATQRWTANLVHPQLTVNNLNICNHPNLLRPWRRIITFGLACVTMSGQDPVSAEDFVNGNASLYVLTATEVADVEATLYDGVLQ